MIGKKSKETKTEFFLSFSFQEALRNEKNPLLLNYRAALLITSFGLLTVFFFSKL